MARLSTTTSATDAGAFLPSTATHRQFYRLTSFEVWPNSSDHGTIAADFPSRRTGTRIDTSSCPTGIPATHASTLGSTAVPGQAAGYAYQFDLALDQLADGSSGGRVGIETLDDVTKEEDGAKTLSQGKSSVTEHATPFGDNSFGLWNALHTWCDS